jgi:hypothetical protein
MLTLIVLAALLPASAPSAAPATDCGSVIFTPNRGAEIQPTGEFYEYITIQVRRADGTVKAEQLDYPWIYANEAADPWSPKNRYGDNTMPVVFHFPPQDKLSRESALVQFVASHTTKDGASMLRDCPKVAKTKGSGGD